MIQKLIAYSVNIGFGVVLAVVFWRFCDLYNSSRRVQDITANSGWRYGRLFILRQDLSKNALPKVSVFYSIYQHLPGVGRCRLGYFRFSESQANALVFSGKKPSLSSKLSIYATQKNLSLQYDIQDDKSTLPDVDTCERWLK